MSDSKVVSKHNTKGLWFSPEFLMRKTHFSQFLRKFRRFYLGAFNKEYVNNPSLQNAKVSVIVADFVASLFINVRFSEKTHKSSLTVVYMAT